MLRTAIKFGMFVAACLGFTTYLAEIRNPNPELAPAAPEGHSTGH